MGTPNAAGRVITEAGDLAALLAAIAAMTPQQMKDLHDRQEWKSRKPAEEAAHQEKADELIKENWRSEQEELKEIDERYEQQLGNLERQFEGAKNGVEDIVESANKIAQTGEKIFKGTKVALQVLSLASGPGGAAVCAVAKLLLPVLTGADRIDRLGAELDAGGVEVPAKLAAQLGEDRAAQLAGLLRTEGGREAIEELYKAQGELIEHGFGGAILLKDIAEFGEEGPELVRGLPDLDLLSDSSIDAIGNAIADDVNHNLTNQWHGIWVDHLNTNYSGQQVQKAFGTYKQARTNLRNLQKKIEAEKAAVRAKHKGVYVKIVALAQM